MMLALSHVPRFAAAILLAATMACSGSDAGSPDGGGDGNVDADVDADPNCHIDCFGHAECRDGVATSYYHAPVPCDRWQGHCPIMDTYQCVEGCRTDVAQIDVVDLEARIMCEEHRPKRVGDPCADESDCRPQVADVPWDGGPITHVYLRCDIDAGRCVTRPPPLIPDWLASCGIALGDEIRDRIHETTACAGGVCAIGGSSPSCVEQGCTARCADDGDCPPGSLCSAADHLSAPRACTPSRDRLLGNGLSCPPAPGPP
jgi:hypothetical protein